VFEIQSKNYIPKYANPKTTFCVNQIRVTVIDLMFVSYSQNVTTWLCHI